MSNNEEKQRLAAELQRAASTSDLEAVRGLFADDATIWHNFDDTAKPAGAALDNLGGMFSVCTRSWHEEPRATVTDDGFVLQHYNCAELVTGEQVRVPSCIIATVRDGQISRFEEYIEVGAAAPLFAAIAAAAGATA
ncbi:MAG TPA: nuclear transport factor 2 family protein [Solirubrobacteraceae bacterium]|nr:nuclear transport factor 2 family protein [Solirubrobacteraceae bacterium]